MFGNELTLNPSWTKLIWHLLFPPGTRAGNYHGLTERLFFWYFQLRCQVEVLESDKQSCFHRYLSKHNSDSKISVIYLWRLTLKWVSRTVFIIYSETHICCFNRKLLSVQRNQSNRSSMKVLQVNTMVKENA